jgi:hypothetical protein
MSPYYNSMRIYQAVIQRFSFVELIAICIVLKREFFAGCHEDPQFLLRSDRRGTGQIERQSAELSVCSRRETTFSLY